MVLTVEREVLGGLSLGLALFEPDDSHSSSDSCDSESDSSVLANVACLSRFFEFDSDTREDADADAAAAADAAGA